MDNPVSLFKLFLLQQVQFLRVCLVFIDVDVGVISGAAIMQCDYVAICCRQMILPLL